MRQPYTPAAQETTISFAHGYAYGFARGIEMACNGMFITTSNDDGHRSYLDLSPHDNSDVMEAIFKKYEIEDGDISLFLREHSDLSSLLLEVPEKIPEYFQNVRNITLELYEDPESNRKFLLSRIFVSSPVKEAFESLNRFDSEWFANEFVKFPNLFNITIEAA